MMNPARRERYILPATGPTGAIGYPNHNARKPHENTPVLEGRRAAHRQCAGEKTITADPFASQTNPKWSIPENPEKSTDAEAEKRTE